MKKDKFYNLKYFLSLHYCGLAFFSLLMSSCNKNLCDNSICLNGGVCVDGNCQCAGGYSGKHCDVYDLCYNVVCNNGGYCELGECFCPPGWEGSDCSQKSAPARVLITKIEVLKFPALKQMGVAWDGGMAPDNRPDIFPNVQKDSVLIWSGLIPVLNAESGTVYSFTPSPAIELTSPAATYSVGIMDSDLPWGPEPMGKLFFTPYVQGNGFPASIVIDPGGPLAFRLSLTYIW